MVDFQSYSINIKSSIRNYSVSFIDSIESHVKENIKEGDIIIIDENINLFNNRNDRIIRIKASEKTKSFDGINVLLNKIIKIGITKKDKIICIGGGTIQDACSFSSSILLRGIDWIFYPTTLLAQADSCVGGKTSINFGNYKNQIGNFYPPSSIYIDVNVLKFLKEDHILSGIGEMSHYFFIKGSNDLEFFKNNYKKCLDVDNETISIINIIHRTICIKKEYIEIDEFDKGPRIVFNYGHTFGHAIESITKYSTPHGIAVSIGMDIANYISMKKGYINYDTYINSRDILCNIWGGFYPKDLNIELMIDCMMKDKKNENNKIGLILTKGYGNMFKELINPKPDLFKYLNDYKDEYIKK